MSALRIAVPGCPVRLVDVGPAVGRIYGQGILYGEMAVGVSERERQREHNRQQNEYRRRLRGDPA